jgi:uncharacterized protein (DUF58 family)
MRITSRGVGLLLAALALLSTGFSLGYPELTVIGTTAAVALVFAVGYVAWRPELSVVRRTDPDRVMRGEPSQVTLTVSNASRLRAATLIAHDRCGAATVGVPLLRLRAGRETTVRYPVPTERRGVVPVGPLRVVRRDPLGLLTMPRAHGEIDRVWVYPMAHPLAAVPPGVARSLDGLVDRVPHGSITFDTLREYVIGDELRHVHWRTTARIGQLMVREHVDTSLPRLVILLDDRAVAYPDAVDGWVEAFESVCEAAASILLAATTAELPIALHLVTGAAIESSGRQRSTRPYLDLLAEVTLAGRATDGPGTDGRGTDGRGTDGRQTDDHGVDEHAVDARGHGGPGPAGRGRRPADPLFGAVTRLRHNRPGDTLIFLTGPGRAEDIGLVGSLLGAYPTVVVATIGTGAPTPAAMEGVLMVSAVDGTDFAGAWDGVATW